MVHGMACYEISWYVCVCVCVCACVRACMHEVTELVLAGEVLARRLNSDRILLYVFENEQSSRDGGTKSMKTRVVVLVE